MSENYPLHDPRGYDFTIRKEGWRYRWVVFHRVNDSGPRKSVDSGYTITFVGSQNEATGAIKRQITRHTPKRQPGTIYRFNYDEVAGSWIPENERDEW